MCGAAPAPATCAASQHKSLSQEQGAGVSTKEQGVGASTNSASSIFSCGAIPAIDPPAPSAPTSSRTDAGFDGGGEAPPAIPRADMIFTTDVVDLHNVNRNANDDPREEDPRPFGRSAQETVLLVPKPLHTPVPQHVVVPPRPVALPPRPSLSPPLVLSGGQMASWTVGAGVAEIKLPSML